MQLKMRGLLFLVVLSMAACEVATTAGGAPVR